MRRYLAALGVAWIASCALACAGRVAIPRDEPARGDAYVESLVRRADWLRLDRERAWLRLGHYREGDFEGAILSEADHASFFVAERGRSDPRAELHATLRAFFAPAVEEPKTGAPRHALCRFPARFAFLSERLHIDPARLPKQRCEPLIAFLREIDPQSVSVVFSAYYLNNPASAFGHTFLRFSKARTLAVGEKRELLDYAIDFSADVDTGNALVYAYKGLFGGFPGTVKRMPYYYKVREYADIESRDLFDYELSFGKKQLFMLLAHIWELGPTYFAYFYLDENCSYRINRMLEVADPTLELTDFDSPVLPADTIKAIVRAPGLVRKVSYRPSLRTVFVHAVAELSDRERDLVEALFEDPNAELPDSLAKESRVRVLDAAVDLIDMRHMKEIMLDRRGEASLHKQRLLERRAALSVPSKPEPIPAPWDKRPELGHDSKRLGVSLGGRHTGWSGEQASVGIDFRLAMHDLADPAPGYPELAQLEFLPLRLRVLSAADRPQRVLDDFAIVRVVSLTSMGRFDMSPSWRFSLGARSLEREGCDLCLAGALRLGGGAAQAWLDDALTVFLIGDAVLYAGPEVSGIAGREVRLGVGPSAGMRLRLTPRLIALSSFEWLFFPTQRDAHGFQADAVLRLGLDTHEALSLEARARSDRFEAQLFFLAYL